MQAKSLARSLADRSKFVIVAELVGASTGVGFRMLQQQSLLNMSGVLAWTLVLVVSGFGMQFVISKMESRLLRWRPTLSS